MGEIHSKKREGELHSRSKLRECAAASSRLDLQVLGRGLAAIGDLFVFNSLSFIKRRKPGLLNRRNVNKSVLAACAGLDETIALCWVEPLDRTFSHSRRLRGIHKVKRTPGPRTYRQARNHRIRGL